MNLTIVNKHRTDVIGGSEIQCDFIATELTKRGHKVSYVAPAGTQEKYHTSYTVLTCKNEGSEIVETVLATDPDIVYWRFNKHFFYESMKKLRGIDCKIIFATSHKDDLHWFRYKKQLSVRKNVKNFLKSIKEHLGVYYVDAVVVNNKDHLNILSVKPQLYIPNGMTETSAEFSWKRPYCVWIANIKRFKRPELFIKLAKEFKNSDIDFLMVGNIQEGNYMWINEKDNLPENVYYLGPKTVEEVNGILKSSLMHVHTCLTEGFPNVFIQAWLQSIPSVSYEFDPSGYISAHNMGYAANGDWELFKKYVTDLKDKPGKRMEMGSNARKFAVQMFNIEKSVTALEKFMNEQMR